MKLIVIPSERLKEYEDKGLVNLEEYYNPGGWFDEVFLLSPKEKEKSVKYGMNVIPVSNAKEYRQWLDIIKPDVVRAYGGYWASRFAIFNKVDGIPVVVSLHDTHPWICYDSLRYTDHCICMTKAVKTLAIKKGLDLQRISILPNRISLHNFLPGTELSDEFAELKGKKYILHVGRRTYQKNLETVIKSLPMLDADLCLVSVGKGNDNRYRQIAKELGVIGRCIWMDKISNDKLSQLYANAIAFVVPSRWEGFGVVFIEAASSGVPIITSNIEPMNEFLSHENAILIDDYEDPKEISKAISMINNSKELNDRLIRNGIALAQTFSREKVNNQEIEIYEKVISNKSTLSAPSLILKFIIYMKSVATYCAYRIESKVKK